MFVQEEKIFAGKVLRLHVCAFDGAEWLEEATEDTSVEKLKERCLKHVRPATLQASPLLPPTGPWGPDRALYPHLLVQLPSRQPGGRGASGTRAGRGQVAAGTGLASCGSRIHPSALAVAQVPGAGS